MGVGGGCLCRVKREAGEDCKTSGLIGEKRWMKQEIWKFNFQFDWFI